MFTTVTGMRSLTRRHVRTVALVGSAPLVAVAAFQVALALGAQCGGALTDADLTARYWGHANVSGWQPGSAWEHRRADTSGAIDVTGTARDPVRHVSLRKISVGHGQPDDVVVGLDQKRHDRRSAGPCLVGVLERDHEPGGRLGLEHASASP